MSEKLFDLNEKTVTVKGVEFTLKELTFEDNCDINARTTEINVATGKQKTDIKEAQFLRIFKSIKTIKKDGKEVAFNEKMIRELPEGIALVLGREVDKWLLSDLKMEEKK